MLRFVLDPDRDLVPDLAGKLPGRGMWLSARADVLERAIKRGAFAKAARGTVHLPPDLAARIEDGLRGRIRDLVGFARRSGKAVCGRESVREWLQAGKAGLLVEASDGSAAERSRLVGSREMPVVAPLPADVLGSVFARDHAVHVAIAPGRLAKAIARRSGTARRHAGRRQSGQPSRRVAMMVVIGETAPWANERLGWARHLAPGGITRTCPRLRPAAVLWHEWHDGRRIGYGPKNERPERPGRGQEQAEPSASRRSPGAGQDGGRG